MNNISGNFCFYCKIRYFVINSNVGKNSFSFVYISTFHPDKKRVTSQHIFRLHDQLMIMIMSCSSTTPTCKFPSYDVVTLSSNDI